jgi:asparagine synthase (glutamine-hydrolysing)
MYRYLALVWNPHNLESARTVATLAGATIPSNWTTAYEGPGIKLLRTDTRRTSATVYPLSRNGGVIFGRLFDGHREIQVPRAISFDADESHKVIASGGQHIVDRYWGAYIAIAYDEAGRRHHVFRDPTGALPCYHTHHRGIDLFFSHMQDAVCCLPGPFAIDRDYLARWLYLQPLANASTGLVDVKPLPAGDCLTLSAQGRRRTRLWNPVAIAGKPAFEKPDEAARALRSTVQSAVNAWASCYENITHRLTGGLDSSIVAGCLAHVPSTPQLTYLNLAIEAKDAQQSVHMLGVDRAIAQKVRVIAGSGDERYYARMVAKRWQVTMVERKRNPVLDMPRLTQLPLSTGPASYYCSLEMDEAKLEMVRTYGTQAFFSGQGGDSVFFAAMQPLAAIDYAHVHGLRPALWQHLLDSAALSKESLWSVLGKAASHGFLRRRYVPVARLIARPSLLTDEILSHVTEVERSRREEKYSATAALPPGKQIMSQGVGVSPYYDYDFRAGNYADHVNPLDAQPVWELMLRIPTYTILMNGTSRGLARYAFRDLLPEEIRKRISKGSGSPFYQNVVRSHRSSLREYLLDGELVKDGYLDARKLDECLAADDPSTIVFAPTLLSYLSAEIWLQQWRNVGSTSTAGAAPTLRVERH